MKITEKKRLEELSNRKNNPGFIQKMRDVRKGDPSPMEGKTHSDTTIAKISKTAQEIWNKRHGIEDIHEPLEKRNLLFAEWLRITQLLQRYPTSFDIKKLREQEKTKFSKTMYNREFGDGNFTRAKQVLDSLTRTIAFLNELQKNPYNIVNGRVFEEDIKQIASTITETIQEIFSSSSTDELKKRATELEEGLEAFKEQLKVKARKKHQITSRIGANESSIWQYVKEQNLRDKMVQAGKITEQEVDMVENYFEKKRLLK